jgi:hypothetical protein
VYLSKPFMRLAEETREIIAARNVPADAMHRCPKRLTRAQKPALSAREHDDVGTFLQKQARRSESDTAGAARDDGHLVL